MDVRGTTYETFEDLVALLPARGRRDRARLPGDLRLREPTPGSAARAQALADDLGVALQLTNILRDVREDAENGRVYLPAADLAELGCRRATRWPSPCAASRRGGRGRSRGRRSARSCASRPSARAEWFDRGMQLAPLLDRRSAACVLAMAGIYRRLLERIDADPGRVAARARLAAGAREGVGRGARPARGRRREARASSSAAGSPGITAALDCADAGAQVTLVEVRRRLGGAAYSFERDGLQHGQRPARVPALLHRLPRAARAARQRAELVSLQPRLRDPRAGARAARRTVLRRSALPAPAAPRRRARALPPPLARASGCGAARAALALARLDPTTRRSTADASATGSPPRPGPAAPSRAVGPDRAADAQPAGRGGLARRSARSCSARACSRAPTPATSASTRAPLQQTIGDPAAARAARGRRRRAASAGAPSALERAGERGFAARRRPRTHVARTASRRRR